MNGTGGQGATGADGAFAAAHRALRADPAIQFDLYAVRPPPPPPAWLKSFGEWLKHVLAPVGRLFAWIGRHLPDAPYARILLWTVVAAAVALLLWAVWERLRGGAWRLPRLRRRTLAGPVEEAGWVPEAAPARAWLAEADRLAAEGRFGEAVHHLLLRSVEDIARRRPQLLRPASTSRELARADALPGDARRLFATIAGVVERSLFGRRAVAEAEWAACRASYADFTQPRLWAR